jgi:uncharacterized membrane protein YdbT with pleckstrin-like domain
MSPAASANLIQNESVITQASIHWWAAYGTALLLAGLGLVLALPTTVTVGAGGALLFGLFAVAAALSAGVGWARQKGTEFVVTSRRVSAKFGLVHQHSIELMLERIEGISVKQNPVGSLLGYGSIVVHGIGGTHEPIPYVRDAQHLRTVVQNQLARAGV